MVETGSFNDKMKHYFAAEKGEYTTFTDIEVEKSTYNVKANIRDLLIEKLGEENIPRVKETSNQTIKFRIYSEQNIAEYLDIQCKFSKSEKREMTIYFTQEIKEKINIFAGYIWYIFFEEGKNIPILGTMEINEWNMRFFSESNDSSVEGFHDREEKEMNLQILDKKEMSSEKGCLLCKASLLSYLNALEDGFDQYAIQRNIVDNKYLDTISNTVMKKEHIPIITLVVTEDAGMSIVGNELKVYKFQILDGLQRTWRLNAFKKYANWLNNRFETEERMQEELLGKSMRVLLPSERKEILSLGVSDLKQAMYIAKQINANGGFERVNECLRSNEQWFEIWYGLSENEIINKMLLLNAGHKTMNTRHQIELLYFNWLDLFSSVADVQIDREKDNSSSVTYVNTRQPRHYKFSDLVLATLAFQNGKYNEIQSAVIAKTYVDKENIMFETDRNYYGELLKFIADVDTEIYKVYSETGRLWFGRENNLEAFTAAIGKWCLEHNSDKSVSKLLEECLAYIKNNIEGLNLGDFEDAKKSLEVSKISIGQKTKNIVYNAIYEFIADGNSNIKWNYFIKMR